MPRPITIQADADRTLVQIALRLAAEQFHADLRTASASDLLPEARERIMRQFHYQHRRTLELLEELEY